jgi:hypothetical protein
MTFIPSWVRDIYPRLCSKCGLNCRSDDKPHRNKYRRVLCLGCLEFFCDDCATEHDKFGGGYGPEKPACGKSAEDHDHLGDDEKHIPGWKVAFIQKHIPNAVVTEHQIHTAGWSLKFFLKLVNTPIPLGQADDGSDVTYPCPPMIHRVQLELICEGLGGAWIIAPTSTLQPSPCVAFSKEHPEGKCGEVPPPEVPEGCENGIMIALNKVCT